GAGGGAAWQRIRDRERERCRLAGAGRAAPASPHTLPLPLPDSCKPMERVLDVSRKAAGVLAERGFEQARLESELLLAGVLGVKRLDLYLQHDRPLSPEELERYRTAVRRRLKHEPVQYILGTAAFRHLEVNVDGRVLIPRPETELLVGAVLEWSSVTGRRGAVLDIGTGSGAIALSLAAEGGYERVVASDVSPDALDVARANAERLGLADRIEFRAGSL